MGGIGHGRGNIGLEFFMLVIAPTFYQVLDVEKSVIINLSVSDGPRRM